MYASFLGIAIGIYAAFLGGVIVLMIQVTAHARACGAGLCIFLQLSTPAARFLASREHWRVGRIGHRRTETFDSNPCSFATRAGAGELAAMTIMTLVRVR